MDLASRNSMSASRLSDDAGTTYPLRSRSVGGTGRLFRGDWYFAAGVPEDAASVVIHVEGNGEQTASVTVDLRGSGTQ
jgi:hypothetical protein